MTKKHHTQLYSTRRKNCFICRALIILFVLCSGHYQQLAQITYWQLTNKLFSSHAVLYFVTSIKYVNGRTIVISTGTLISKAELLPQNAQLQFSIAQILIRILFINLNICQLFNIRQSCCQSFASSSRLIQINLGQNRVVSLVSCFQRFYLFCFCIYFRISGISTEV